MPMPHQVVVPADRQIGEFENYAGTRAGSRPLLMGSDEADRVAPVCQRSCVLNAARWRVPDADAASGRHWDTVTPDGRREIESDRAASASA